MSDLSALPIGVTMELVLKLLDLFTKDELEKITSHIEKKVKEWNNDKQELLEALASDDIDIAVINRFISKYLDRVQSAT